MTVVHAQPAAGTSTEQTATSTETTATTPPPTLQDEYGAMDHSDLYFHLASFALESGMVLDNVRVAYRTWGSLSTEADNCLVVPHALTGNAAVDTWWAALLGDGKALDTSRYFVVGVNMLGSPYGTTSPLDEFPEHAAWITPRGGARAEGAAGRRYAADFPNCTIRDNVRLQQLLLVQLGVRSVHSVIGGSAGGMQALEWAVMYPAYVQRAAVLACGAKQCAWQIAIGETQRRAIYRDPLWNDGFYSLDDPPVHGLAIARENAMVWYRSAEAYDDKFGRHEQLTSPGSVSRRALDKSGGGGRGAPPSFAVEGYLEHQGQKFVDRFDGNCYVALTRTLDSHDVTRGRGSLEEVLGGVQLPVLVAGITSDVLYPLHMQRELAACLPRATLRVIESAQGHDAFLLESTVIGGMIRALLATSVRGESEAPPATAPPKPILLPTAEVLSHVSAEALAKRKAANIEGTRTAGSLGAVAW